jgi:hypothetical protein
VGVVPFAARAAWDVVPVVGLTTEVDDNARLVPVDQPDSTRTALDARLRLRAFGERGEAFIEPRFISDAYADKVDEELENTDTFLLTRAAYDFGKSNIAFRTDYRRESVLRSEVVSAIDDNPALGPPPIDTGAGTLGTFTDQRERLDIGFDTEFTLSQRTKFGLELSRIDVGYPDSTSVTRTPFDDNTLAIVLTRLADRRNEVRARMYASQYHADLNDNDTNAFGVQGEFVRPLSETWTLQFSAGVARTDYTFLNALGQVVSNANNGFVFDVAIDKRSPVTTWSLDVGKSLDPNSNGFLSTRDDVRAQVQHKFTERMTLTGGIRASQVETVAESVFNDQRNYYRATLELAWAMTRRWQVTAGFDRLT